MTNLRKIMLLVLFSFLIQSNNSFANDTESKAASNTGLELIFGETNIPQNGFGCVPVSVNNFSNILSLQLTIEFDSSMLNFHSIANLNTEINNLNLANFGTPNQLPQNLIAFSWFDIDSGSLIDGSVLFEICFDAIGPAGVTTNIGIDNSPDALTPLEAAQIFNEIEICTSPIAITIGPSIAIDSIANAGEYSGGLLNPICSFENLTIQTDNFQEIDGWFDNAAIIDSLPIPDGTGMAYSSTIMVNDFEEGALFNSATSIQICIVIEHSFLRDLNIVLQCPNGNEITLHEFAGQSGGEIFLGIPFEDDEFIMSIPGQGWEYCWNMEATNGTWIEVANQINFGTLPAGDYQPFDDFSSLNGCPINGDWSISVEDLWGIDDGWVFSWDMTLHEGNQYNQTYVFSNEAQEIVAQTDESGFFDFSNNQLVSGNYEIYAFNYKSDEPPLQFDNLSELSCNQDVNCCDLLLLTPVTVSACDICDNLLLEINLPDSLTLCGDSIEISPEITFLNMGGTFDWEGVEVVDHNQPTIVELLVSNISPNNLLPSSINKICIDSLLHTLDDDLQIYLITPSNDTLELSTDNGATGNNYINTCFSPTAINSITLDSPPFTGTYLPEGNFESIFGSNKPVNGIWKLLLIDKFPGFNGELYKWSITFNEPSTNLSYDWTPATGLSCHDCPNPIASPTQPTTYTFTVTTEDTCSVVNYLTILNSGPSTCIDDGNCMNGFETWDTTSCECIVELSSFGCTDPTAINYDPMANCDDGSCLFSNPCGNTDSLQLVMFFNATGGNNWINKTNWLQSGQPIGSWYGITTNTNGCITCIDLDGNANCLLDNNSMGNNLVGVLPALDIPSLETIYLDDNLLTGCHPDFLCSVDNVSLAGNVQMPWYGDIENFCEGFEQFNSPCDNGTGSTINGFINMDCECDNIVGTTILSEINFDVFPNPTTDQIFINSSHTTNYNATLYNILGQPVFNGIGATTINVKELPKGTYLLVLVDENNRRILKKVVVE